MIWHMAGLIQIIAMWHCGMVIVRYSHSMGVEGMGGVSLVTIFSLYQPNGGETRCWLMINDLINQQPGSHISFASPSNEHKVNSTKLYKGDFHLERLINLTIDAIFVQWEGWILLQKILMWNTLPLYWGNLPETFPD